jgi:O-antigen/teichoic acid export membrane protein
MSVGLLERIPLMTKGWWYGATSPLEKRLAQGAFWSLAGALIARGLSLLAFIFVARVLGKEGFGELGIIQSTVGMFGVFAGFGMGLTASKYVAELRFKDPVRAGRIIALSNRICWITSSAIAVMVVILAPWLASRFLAAPHLSVLVQISSILLLFSGVAGAQTGALSGLEAFRKIAQVNLLAGLLSFPLIVGGVLCWGLAGALWGLILSQMVSCLLNHWALRAEAGIGRIPLQSRGCLAEWRVLWQFAFPAVLSGVLVGPVNWICSALLVNQANGYAEMGVFNATIQWRNIILFVPSTFGSVALPLLSGLQESSQLHHYNRVLLVNAALSFISALAIALPVSLLAAWIMAGYGKAFVPGAPVLVLVCLATVIMAVLNVVGQSIASDGKMWFGFALNLIWAAALLASFKYLTPKGAMGLATANVYAYGLHLLTVLAYIIMRQRTRAR